MADGNTPHPDNFAATHLRPVPLDGLGEREPQTFKPLEFNHARDAKVDRSCSDYLIKGILDRGTTGVLYGKRGAGKTFAGLAMARAIAAGDEVMGRKTKQTPIFYLGLEGSKKSLELRVKAASESHDADDPFYWDRATGDQFQNETFVQHLIEQFKRNKIGLVIIDTLARVIGQQNENGEGMGFALALADRITQETGAAVLLIAHAGKTEGRGIRGHSSIEGAVDFIGAIERDGDARSLICEKVKDGEDGLRYDFTLELVDFGEDLEGDAITTLRAVDFTRGRAKAGRANHPKDQLYECIQSVKFDQPDHKGSFDGGPPTPIVYRDAVVEKAINAGVFTEAQLTDDTREQLTGRTATYQRSVSSKSPLMPAGQAQFSKLLNGLKPRGITFDRTKITHSDWA